MRLRDLARRALGTLACVTEPLNLDTLVALAGIAKTEQYQRELRTLITGRLRVFVRAVGEERNRNYTTLHDSVRDYFTGRRPIDPMTGDEQQLDELEVTARAIHRRIIDRYVTALYGTRDNFPDRPITHPAVLGTLDAGYGLRNLTAHLEALGEGDMLHQLLTTRAVLPDDQSTVPTNIWLAAHEKHGAFTEYRADLARGHRLAARAVDRELLDGGKASTIGLEVRYALMAASIESIISNVTPELLRVLVAGRVWKPIAALGRIRAVGNYRTRVELIAALLRAQHEEEDHPCLTGEDASEAWNLIVPPASKRAVEVAGQLLPRLPESDRGRITHYFLGLGLDSDLPQQAQMLSIVIAGGCLGPEELDIAIDRVLSSQGDEEDICMALRGLLPHTPPAGLERIYHFAKDRQPFLHGWGRVHRALALRLAEHSIHSDWVAHHVKAELVALALGVGYHFGKTTPRDQDELRTLVRGLDEAHRIDALNTVLRRATESDPEYHGLGNKLSHVSEFFCGTPLERVLAIARRIDPRLLSRAQILATLVPAVPEHRRPKLVTEALDVLSTKSFSGDPRPRNTLRVLAGHVSGKDVARAQKLIRSLEEEDQAELLAILARRVPGRAGADLRREAVDIAARRWGWRRGEIIVAIAPYLDHETRIRAFDLVPGIGYGTMQKYRDAVLDALVAQPMDEEELRHAQLAAERIHDRLPQAGALAALAGQVSRPDRHPLCQRVEELVESFADVPDRADPLIELARGLQDDDGEILRRAAEFIPEKRDSGDLGFFVRLRAVRPILTEKEIHKRLLAALDQRLYCRDVWAALAPAELRDRRLWNKVRKKLFIGGEDLVALYFAMVADHLTESEIDEVTAESEQLHPRFRALPLAALAHRLDTPHRERVIRRVLADMHSGEEDGDMTNARTALDPQPVADLAKAMTESERDELLDIVLRRLRRDLRFFDVLGRLLPHLSGPQRARALEVGTESLRYNGLMPGHDVSAVARYANVAFLRTLIEVTRYRSDDIKSRAIASILDSPAADRHAASWNDRAGDRVAPVRELLDDLARPGLLTVLRAAAPHIGHYGGMYAAQDCAEAIQEVAQLWP